MELETIRVSKILRAMFPMLVLEMVIWSSEATLDPLDFLALQSIWKTMDDMPTSTFFRSRDIQADSCRFSGLLCKSQGEPDRVATLNLGDGSTSASGLTDKMDGVLGCI